MQRCLGSIALILAISVLRPAAAIAIPIDPVIGVRGGGGSEPSNTNAFLQMEPCIVGSYTSDVFCFEYLIVQNVQEITSLTFQYMDADGLIPNSFLFPDPLFNELDGFERLDDGFSVRLFATEGNLQCFVFDGETQIFVPCAQGSTIQPYLHVPPDDPFGPPNPPYFISLRAINDVAVPEPGLLVLMGIGLMLAARRLRRRGTSA